MSKREFMQLAHKYEPKKHRIAGWFMSEKLDGLRAFWDGGITRELSASEVPWANTAKHGRFVTPPMATGLWSRYGQPIQAPDWFLDELPPFPLDGELYAGRGKFQFVTSVVRTSVPDQRWRSIRFCIFDMPSYTKVFAAGEVNNVNFKKVFNGCYDFAISRAKELDIEVSEPLSFEKSYSFFKGFTPEEDGCHVVAHRQERLPFTTTDAEARLREYLEEVCDAGGEGVVLRNPVYHWTPERAHHILKVKPFHDDEGTVIGYVWGRETDKGSKLLGLMGALVLDYRGKRFELSGFTDAERRMTMGSNGGFEQEQAKIVGSLNPGQPVDPTIWNPTFPIGSRITFRYRELTDAGLPKEARYWRKHEEG